VVSRHRIADQTSRHTTINVSAPDAAARSPGGEQQGCVWLAVSVCPTRRRPRETLGGIREPDRERRCRHDMTPRALLLLLPLLLAGCTTSRQPSSPSPASPSASPASAAPCRPVVRTDALPTWARAGFTGDGDGIPYVMSRAGDILGVLFGTPLNAPPAPDHNNKILWVSHAPVSGGDLLITAKRDGTTDTVERKVTGGPGPSIVDLPEAGCWRLTLRWSGHTDTMDLLYARPGSAGVTR